MEIKYIEPSVLHDEMLRLRKEKQMDFLECLSGMDWGIPDEKDAPDTPRGLGVVYLLESTVTGERIAGRTATLNREHPELPSVSDIWKAADFNEREVYDFYGIVFIGHPDMRRLYLRNDWVGYPMRKDNEPEKDNPLRMDNEETVDTTMELELNPDGSIKNKEMQLFGDEEYVVNIGPQHPATHGVMRFRVSLEGEIIDKIDANCGYIHRGIEKMCESLTYPQTLALTDRLISESGLTAMMVTHNMRDAIAHGNRLIMMDAGKIIYDVSGDEKKHLTVESLLSRFSLSSDRALLG